MTIPAHAGGTAFIQLLPTHIYTVGAAVTVAVSFALVVLIPAGALARLPSRRARIGTMPARAHAYAAAVSLAAFAVVAALIVAGIAGSRDPYDNPLPLVVWTVWWIGFTYLHAIFGNVWSVVNPWRGVWHAVTRGPLAGWRARPPLAYPDWLAGWPAVLGFVLFAWFELIHPAPMDGAILAHAVAAYVTVHLVATLMYGPTWLVRAETFSVFFRTVAGVSPFARGPRHTLDVTVPAAKLLDAPPLHASGVVFVVLVLASVSFDGLSRTFAWLTAIGVNPLVYPGRTALMWPNTLGLAGLFVALALAYVAAVALGKVIGGVREPVGALVRTFALALVPIVCGYHFAHYLPVFLVDAQWAVRAVSDPFARGWNVFGTRDLHVITSLVSDASRVYLIWHAQVALIVLAHVAGVVVAHGLAGRVDARPRALVAGQLPLLVLMIGYTTLGLWLLSTPAVG